MKDARFRPTVQQALARCLYLGALVSLVLMAAALIVTTAALTWAGSAPPHWLWPLLAFGPLLVALLVAPRHARRGTEIDARGIRTAAAVEPWSTVVDLRAERRGARTVVSVYLDGGRSVQLSAPYSGELFAADPQFELKVGTLSHLWRAHRFGGLPG